MLRHLLPALCLAVAPPALADPIVNETAATETRIELQDGAYLIHTVNRRHDITSFFDDRDGPGSPSGGVMRRFLVQTEIDRVTREADDAEIDVQSSALRRWR